MGIGDMLQAERDAEDAKRYRWLRSQADVVDEDGGWASHFTLPHIPRHNDSPDKRFQLKNVGFDKSIDRAMTSHTSCEKP